VDKKSEKTKMSSQKGEDFLQSLLPEGTPFKMDSLVTFSMSFPMLSLALTTLANQVNNPKNSKQHI
jgi:hypothetical protein